MDLMRVLAGRKRWRQRLVSLALGLWTSMLAVACHAAPAPAPAPAPAAQGFELIALGVEGGLNSSDLSAWLIRAPGDSHYLGLDAGTVLPGIEQALQQQAFKAYPWPSLDGWRASGWMLRQGISAWFISHPHLDHVGGLLIAATDDTHKPIYGLQSTMDGLSQDYFNWSAWPNFADRGAAPALAQYALQAEPAGQSFAIAGTHLQAQIFPLQHDRMRSSMLLLRDAGLSFAYFGDTGPDQPQRSQDLLHSWQVLAALIKQHQLSGLLIETSYPNGVDDAHLYGHLTPAWLLRELHRLATLSGGMSSLQGLTVVISHIKPSLRQAVEPRRLIAQQLQQGNDLGVHFVLPRQGDRLCLLAPAASR